MMNHLKNPNQDFIWKIKLMNGRTIRMFVKKEDPRLFWMAAAYHNISPQLCMIENELNNLLSAEQVYFDIGANQGMRSYLMLDSNRRTFMFEPNPYLNNINKERCELNNFDNYKLEQLCLSDKDGIQTFYFSTEHSMSSLEKDFAEVRGISKEEQVKTTTLDSYIKENDIHGMHPLIKIDVEGHEMNVIKGAEETIQKLKPTFIIEIFSNEHINELYTKFSNLNYSIYGVNFGSEKIITKISNIDALNNYKASDYLFVNQDNIVQYLNNKYVD